MLYLGSFADTVEPRYNEMLAQRDKLAKYVHYNGTRGGTPIILR